MNNAIMLELMAKVRAEAETIEREHQLGVSDVVLSEMLWLARNRMTDALCGGSEKMLVRALAWGVLAYEKMKATDVA